MNLNVSIQKPRDNQSMEIFEEVMNQKDLLLESGIIISEKKSKSLSPEIYETLLVAVTGGVATNLVKTLIDYLMDKIKKKKYYGIKLIIRHKNHEFKLPSAKRECHDYFSNLQNDE